MAFSIVVPDNRQEIKKQIKALEYLLSVDIREKDKQIHQQAIKQLKAALKNK